MFAGCRCPRCPDSVLDVRVVEGRKVLACPSCAGTFIGAKLGLRLLAVLEADVRAPNPARACPVCKRDMRTVVAAETEVEVCKTHGVWCDADELPRLVRAVAGAVGKPVPAALAEPETKPDAVPSVGDVHHATEPSDLEVAKDWAGAAVDEALSPITDLPMNALFFLDDLLS